MTRKLTADEKLRRKIAKVYAEMACYLGDENDPEYRRLAQRWDKLVDALWERDGRQWQEDHTDLED